MTTEYMFDDPYTIDDYDDDDMIYDDDELELYEPTHYSAKSFAINMTKMVDGLGTLALMADTLRDYADFLDSMHEEGFQLSQPILDGVGFAYNVIEEVDS